jgi:23S rRNA pseudouridine1911/1915/1917 synthase
MKANRPALRLHERVDVIHEDPDLIVIEKAGGIISYPMQDQREESAIQLIRRYWKSQNSSNRNIYLIHRLDKETAGLMVFAKTTLARRNLLAQFEQHEVLRGYLAITQGVPSRKRGELKTHLGRNHRGIRSVQRTGKFASTQFETLSVTSSGQRALVRCRLQTGRTHQVRIHLAHLDAPVIGDRVYGNDHSGKSLALYADLLGFKHPRFHHPIVFRTSMPLRMKKLLSEPTPVK